MKPVFLIDSHIPAPVPSGKRIYPWHELKVGDSFFVRNRTPAVMAACYAQVQKTTKMRFMARREGFGTRVWRVTSFIGMGFAAVFASKYAHWAITDLYPLILGQV